jgi:hypothetical protein
MKNLYGMGWRIGKKENVMSNPILKMAMGSQIGLLGRKRSFQRGMGEHA